LLKLQDDHKISLVAFSRSLLMMVGKPKEGSV
jgi:hypothetical protein